MMEKRMFGIILTILGIVGLIMAANSFVNTHGGNRDVRMIIVYGLLGIVFFSSGVGLIRNTKDVKSKNEEVS
ncbi:MAG: hypothetical protein JST70_06190 [Bacteroidetes bacterium]|nr:hypothetical protein [Bacteroidota bacterium]